LASDVSLKLLLKIKTIALVMSVAKIEEIVGLSAKDGKMLLKLL
jgi:hypothetical protein